ncbi:MAG: methyltransferase domain-containing protein [Candidatus Saccharibacteria bacterium]
MVSFKNRAFQPELMDGPGIPASLLHHNLGELDILNRYFGGHFISMEGIRQLMTDRTRTYHIVDLGCGSGDVLKYIARWARSNSFTVKLTGVDINADAIDYLTRNCSAFPEIKGVVSSYKEYLSLMHKIDIVHCSLFCHHLNEQELLKLFQELKKSSCGFIINDLQRSLIAYWGAWVLPRLLNGTYLSKHDGPVSVQNAFTKEELLHLLHSAGVEDVEVKWRWPFRYLVIAKTDQHGNG